MEIKLKKQQAEFLRMCSSAINLVGNGVFYYMPFWWKQTDPSNNIFEMLSFDSLPDELKKAINDFHENGITTANHCVSTYVGEPSEINIQLTQKEF